MNETRGPGRLTPVTCDSDHYEITYVSMLQEYDYVVVGAGSAGSVIAGRLSEEAEVTVAVVEEGGHETILSEVPGLAGELQLSRMDWQYRIQPSSTTCLAMKNNRLV